MKSVEVVSIAFLVSVAVLAQIFSSVLSIPREATGFLAVDLVGVPAVAAFYLFGLQDALYVAFLTTLLTTLLSPDSWLAASLKFAGVMPMLLVPATYALYKKGMDAGKLAAILVVGFAYSLTAFVISGAVNLVSQAWIGVADPLVYGLLPIIALALYAVALHYLWQRMKKELKCAEIGAPKLFVEMLSLSVAVKAAVVAIAFYYYAGPLFLGQPAEMLFALVPLQGILAWSLLQGVVEAGIAWIAAFYFKLEKRFDVW